VSASVAASEISHTAGDAETPDVDALWADLDAATDRIARTETHLEQLRTGRAGIYQQLLDAGVKQAEIARRAGVTPTAVMFALDKKAGGKGKRRPARQ
jgi:hypothetical protein